MSRYIKAVKNKKVAIWGWFPRNQKQSWNLGDSWILECMKMKFPNIIPITTNEEDFYKYDFVIIGGGGLLNGPMLRAPFDKPIGTKYGAMGIGGEFEIKDKSNLKKLINFSVFFGVRDSRNIMTYQIEGNRRLKLSGDCTFLYPLQRRKFQRPHIKNIKMIWRDPYGLMKWDRSKHHKEDGEILNKQFGDYLGKIPYNDSSKCLELYKNMLSEYGNLIIDLYRTRDFSFWEIYEKFKNTDLVVSMRYHGVVAAIQLGIPCIAIDIYPKVRTLMTECGLEKYCIKLNEYNKINGLMKNIVVNRGHILRKMEDYTAKQYTIINNFANMAKKKIIYLMNRKKKFHYSLNK